MINWPDTMNETLAAPALVGAVLDGKYRIARMIGHGGMGAVYQAQHLGTDRPVAVKVLLSTLLKSSEALERFRREARAAGRLRHPNIVDVTDFGVAVVEGREVAYLVMEYLEGSTLRSLIEGRGALPVEVVVAIVEQIGVAIEAAHRAGIVHRDLKPDNVWLIDDARGGFTVRVLDFGIARLSEETRIDDNRVFTIDPNAPTLGVGSDAATETPPAPVRIAIQAGEPSVAATEMKRPATSGSSTTDRLTMAGSTLGTPLYMSPEQCDGRDADERSDIYSLGVMTYEMLAGRRPFTGGFQALIDQHLHVPPPPLEGVPAGVAAVVMRALSKDPAGRYTTAQAFAGSLRVAAEGPGLILRRSIALYAERLHELLAISASVSGPPVAVALAIIVAAIIVGAVTGAPNGARVLLLGAGLASLLWTVVTVMTNTTFAAVIERLRLRPLDALDPADMGADVRRRLGLPASAGYAKTFGRLFVYYIRCEMTSKAGAGDLAFLIGFLEGVPLADIPPRCALLAKGSQRAYAVVRGAIFAALFLVPFVEAGVIFMIIGPFTRHGLPLAVLTGFSLLPLNAMLINPVFSSALTLLYFRSRQANGEDVPLSAVLPGRV